MCQEFIGVHTSPYLPFVSLSNQPAELARHNARWNINFLMANAGLLQSQSFASHGFWDMLGKVGMGDLKYFLAAEESLLYLKGRMIIPSITYKLNERHSFGLTMSVRADGIYNSSNDDFLKIFKGIDDPDGLKDIKDEYFRSLVSSWVEYGFAWSSTFFRDDNHWLTGGAVVKLLQGSGAGYLEMNGIDVMFDKERIAHFDMNLSYGFNESLAKTVDGGDIVEQSGDFGIGLDLGVSYSYLPDHLAGVKDLPYKYKLGFVVSDIGYIRHRETKQRTAITVAMQDVPYSRFMGVPTLEALKDSIIKSVDISETVGGNFKTNLPVSFGLSADYCVHPKWFIHGTVLYKPNYYGTLLSLVNVSIWQYNLTMRYETRKIGVYLPLGHNNVLGWNMGLAARYGNFFIGSSTVLSNILGKVNGQQFVYFGMSVPIGSL